MLPFRCALSTDTHGATMSFVGNKERAKNPMQHSSGGVACMQGARELARSCVRNLRGRERFSMGIYFRQTFVRMWFTSCMIVGFDRYCT
jgi:hypothetical protein